VYAGRFFVIDRDSVLEDIARQIEAGARHITFGDADFLNGPGHSLGVARAMHRRFPGVTFDFTAKVEHLLRHERSLPELRSLGCLFVISAVEAMSDTVLEHLAKGHRRADIERLVRLVRRAGVTLRPTWVAFTPWTNRQDLIDMLAFVEGEDLIDAVDPVQYSVRLLVPPGSLLLEQPAMQAHRRGLDQAGLTYRWKHPDPQMDRLQREIAGLVEAAGRAREDIAETFRRVRDLVEPGSRPATRLPRRRARVPRMTEPWFC